MRKSTAWIYKLHWLHYTAVILYLSLLMALLYLPGIAYRWWVGNQDVLTVCTFQDVINPDIFEQFQEATGIKVDMKYCDSDNELWSQLYLNRGQGFDLVTAADLTVNRLKRNGLLQQVDKTRLSNLDLIAPRFLGKPNDPENDYGIPFVWTYYCLGLYKPFFQDHELPDSLAYVYEPNADFLERDGLRFCVFEDNPYDLIFIGALYRFGDVQNLGSEPRFSELKSVMEHQHRQVYAYINANTAFYLSSMVPMALTNASQMRMLMQESPEEYAMVFPKEGSLMDTQNLCIPIGAKHVELAHKLIDFLLQRDIGLQVFQEGGFLPVHNDVIEGVHEICPDFYYPTDEDFTKIVNTNQSLKPEQAELIWLDAKTQN